MGDEKVVFKNTQEGDGKKSYTPPPPPSLPSKQSSNSPKPQEKPLKKAGG